jgi:hypothetical protein
MKRTDNPFSVQLSRAFRFIARLNNDAVSHAALAHESRLTPFLPPPPSPLPPPSFLIPRQRVAIMHASAKVKKVQPPPPLSRQQLPSPLTSPVLTPLLADNEQAQRISAGQNSSFKHQQSPPNSLPLHHAPTNLSAILRSQPLPFTTLMSAQAKKVRAAAKAQRSAAFKSVRRARAGMLSFPDACRLASGTTPPPKWTMMNFPTI